MKTNSSLKSIDPDKPSRDSLFVLGMIPDWLDKLFHLSVTPIMASLSAGRVNPNWITFSGFLLTAFAGYFLLDGRYYHALAFIIFALPAVS